MWFNRALTKLINTDMRLEEIKVQKLFEGIDLDYVDMYSSYGSWLHPSKPQPIMVNDHQGHAAVAKKYMPQDAEPGASPYQHMFNNGWIRAVHGNMSQFSISGTAEALSAFLPKIADLRKVVNRINIDVEDCSGARCQTVKGGSFEMPSQWGALRRAV